MATVDPLALVESHAVQVFSMPAHSGVPKALLIALAMLLVFGYLTFRWPPNTVRCDVAMMVAGAALIAAAQLAAGGLHW